MQLFNVLTTTVTVFGSHFEVSLNWIGELIKNLILGVGSVGLGVIVFSLLLKVIVLPVDVIQRITMRKQNIKMKENQDRMEKLQKQYANNKDLYNQKVMEMYKESGLSMFSSCLPMILSLVIFIVAINAFNAFSQYSNVANYNALADAYNTAITNYCPELTTENITQKVVVKDEGTDKERREYFWVVNDDNSLIYYEVPTATEDLQGDALLNYIENFPNSGEQKKMYYVKDNATELDAELAAYVATKTQGENAVTESVAMQKYFEEKAQDAVLEVYKNDVLPNRTSFLWIKNVWATDASYKNPVLDYNSFKSEVSREKFLVNNEEKTFDEVFRDTDVYRESTYNIITGKLDEYKQAPNGYFVLILLSIGTILLQQFITMRSQKEQQKYSTVDGQGAAQQKTTMITMTLMFAIFSFMYSSAFSIYLIISNLFSMLSTMIINKAVDYADKKKKNVRDERFSSRYAGTVKNKKESDKDSQKETEKEN